MTTAQYQDHADAFVKKFYGAESWSTPLYRRWLGPFGGVALTLNQQHWRDCVGEISEIGHLIVELSNEYPPDDMGEDEYFAEICELYSLEEDTND